MTVFTVTYDNEVLGVFTSFSRMRDYVWHEFEVEFIEAARWFECEIDEENCLDYCDDFGVNWQRRTVED